MNALTKNDHGKVPADSAMFLGYFNKKIIYGMVYLIRLIFQKDLKKEVVSKYKIHTCIWKEEFNYCLRISIY